MSRVKPVQRRYRHFLEPGEPAKDAIRAIGLEIMGSTSKDLEKCAESIKKFAIEARIDLFTLLQTSPHAGLKDMGERQLLLAAAWAIYTAQTLVFSSMAYINEMPKLTPEKRREAIADFIITREELGDHTDQFLQSSQQSQACDHIDRYNSMCISQIRLISRMARVYTVPQRKMLDPPKEFTDQAIEGVQRDDMILFDINVHPKLIGIGFILCTQELACLRQRLLLQDMPLEAINTRLQRTKDAFVADFGTPMTPARYAAISAARANLDTLDLAGKRH